MPRTDRELVKAGKVPLRVVGNFDVDLSTYGYVPDPEVAVLITARRSVARAYLDHYAPPSDEADPTPRVEADRRYWPHREVRPWTSRDLNAVLGMLGRRVEPLSRNLPHTSDSDVTSYRVRHADAPTVQPDAHESETERSPSC